MILKRTSFVGLLLMIAVLTGCPGENDPTAPENVEHTFRYVPHASTPQINSINVAGSFNGWNTTAAAMVRQADNTWQATLRLEPGTYQYKYVFNGDQWPGNMCNDNTWGNPPGQRVDPSVTQCTDDGFGGQNGILVIQ